MGAMNFNDLIKACEILGISGPFSFEDDGKIWTGTDENRVYQDEKQIHAKVAEIVEARKQSLESGRAKLATLGLTQDEINALLGM